MQNNAFDELNVRITSGEHKGLYVATRIGGADSGATQPSDACIAIGKNHWLMVREKGLPFNRTVAQKAMTDLRIVGVDSELVSRGKTL